MYWRSTGRRKREPWLDLKRGVCPSAGDSSVYSATPGRKSEGTRSSGVCFFFSEVRLSVIGWGELELYCGDYGDLLDPFLLPKIGSILF